METEANKYGLFTKLQARPGMGKELGDILLTAADLMEQAKGCMLYIVNRGAEISDTIHVFEVWNSQEDHDASLTLAGARELITQAIPILAGPPQNIKLEVLGGKGLDQQK